MATAPPYYPALTGLRALAAWAVCVHHYLTVPEGGEFPFWHHVLYELHIGVTVFFVLSGFLITQRYSEGFVNGTQRFGAYFLNRFARVYPMYFLLTTATFIACAMGMACKEPPGLSLAENYGLQVSFLRGFFGEVWFTGVTQGWTLTVEECFYLLAPLIFILARKGVFALWLQPLFWISAGLALVWLCRDLDFHGFFSGNKFMLLRTFFGRCFEFYAGVQLALWMRGRPAVYRAGFPRFTLAGFLFILICVVTLAGIKGDQEQGLYTPAGIVVNNLLLPLGICGLLYGLCTEQGLVQRMLGSGLFQLLGKSSYTFYLIHFGLLATLAATWISPNPWLLFLLMNLTAIVLFKAVEEPLNRLLRRAERVQNQ